MKEFTIADQNLKLDFLLSEFTAPPVVDFSADRNIITLGGTANLSWSVTNADTIAIDNGIGSVDPDGTLAVTPAATATYTVSGSGPGGSATATVQVSVIHPEPVINFSAAAETILSGESAWLSWDVTGADTVSIDNGIGGVASIGATGVTPGATTTYTLTATGPGGTATGSVTITVTDPTDPPVVALGASPEVMRSGESVVLSWNVVNATTISIDNGVGDVGANGTLSISPTQTTTYTLSATGPGGTTTGSVTVRISAIGIAITAPTDGQVISRPDVMVRGTFTNPGGIETGITVNGVLAVVHDNEFVANHVPLKAGENTITVTATGDDGDVNDASVTVSREPATDYIRMVATSESGVAPLETTLRVDGTFSFTAGQPSYTGPGTVEFLGSTEENEFNVRVTSAGIYAFTAEVTYEGVVHTDAVSVMVMDQNELDAKLKAVFNGVKTALAAGDVEGAVGFFTVRSQEKYRTAFNSLADRLTLISADMQDVELIYVHEDVAKYRTYRLHDVNGEMKNITYYIYFRVDMDGNWRIEQF